MILQEILRRIKFKIGTTDDISGRAINPIVNNRNIIDELNSQIRQYANITKGIQDVYSFSLNQNQIFIDAPSLALRSESYFHLYAIVNGVVYPMDMRGTRDVYKNFPTSPVTGIPNWFLPFNEGNSSKFGVFPMNANAPNTNTLTADVSLTDTTLNVNSTTGFIANNGRITIGTEKIKYQYIDATHFYGCVRGEEMTNIALHSTADTIYENNIVMHYSRLHIPIIVNDDDSITKEILARNIEVVDEHMEGIIKAVAYNLLVKIDNERANIYKIDYKTLYEQYKDDISIGYYRGRLGVGITQPSMQNERGNAYGLGMRY